MRKLPRFLKRYFWDVDFSKLQKDSYPQYIIERILEYGDEKAVKWLFRHFSRSEIRRTLIKRRGISPLSANYWSLILKLSKSKILCLQKQSQKKLQGTWRA
jgi:hypothetical protein